MSRDQLDAEVKLQLALVRTLQVIGEAAWRISDEYKTRHSELPWRQIATFRHRVVHEFFSVDYDVVWRVATTEMRPLIDALTSGEKA